MLSKKTFIFLLVGAFAWLALLSSPTLAAPVPPSRGSSPSRPPSRGSSSGGAATPALPPATPPKKTPAKGKPKQTPPPKPNLPKSKAELRKHWLKAPTKKTKPSCFFTGMDLGGIAGANPAANTATAKAQCKKAGLKTLEDIWTKNDIVNRKLWNQPTAAEFDKFVVWVSEVFAEESTGTAYLLIPDNVQPRKDSIFYKNEFAEIKKKDKVKKIMRIHFDPMATAAFALPEDSNAERLWWTDGDADPPTRP